MLNVNQKIFFIITALSMIVTLAIADDISIPLEVFESGRLGGSGIDRVSEGMRMGIPFTDKMAIKELNGRPALGLKSNVAYQFRTLARWPSGNVRWAGVTLLSDCKAQEKANKISVVHGAGISAGKMIATERDGVITVNTGPLVVSIRKQHFNLLDKVTIDGADIIKPGLMDVIVTDAQDNIYNGSADGSAIIEENGSVGCVIKATGSNRDKSGKRLLGYLVRMYFYRDSSSVKVTYTCTNDENKENTTKVTVKSIKLVTQLATPPATVRVSGGDSSKMLKAGKDVVFYQARPKGDIRHGIEKEQMAPEAFGAKSDDKGYWIKQGANEIARGTAEESPDLMWMDTVDAKGAGVTTGIRFARGNFPKTLHASANGSVYVDLWPKESNVPHVIAHGSHNTFEVLYSFHAQAVSVPSQAMYRFQYPLIGRCPVAWYNRCTSDTEIYPLYHFISRQEEDKMAEENGWDFPRSNRQRDMVVFRSWYWGDGGFRNQHDFTRISFVNFLRDENIDRAGAYFLYAEDRINYNCDWSIHHGTGRTDLGRHGPVGIKINFEEEHVHWYGIPLFYYGTGDQRIGDAAEEFINKFKEDRSTDRMYGWLRFLGWGVYFLAAGYDVTGEEPFREGLRFHAQNIIENKAQWSKKPTKRRPEWPTWNMEWNRGAFAYGGVDWRKAEAKPVKKWKPGLMTGYIIHDAFWNASSRFPWDDPHGDRFADVCEGIEWLIASECFMENKKQGFFLPYIYNLAGEPKVYRVGSGTVSTAQYSVLLPLLRNGEQYSDNLAQLVAKGSFAANIQEHGFSIIDHPGCQALLYYLLHQKKELDADTAPKPIVDLAVEPMKNGKVKVSWTTPANTKKYQIRYSSKKMVSYLAWDRDKRKYAFSPDEYANWWAAEHIHGEPTVEPGIRQSAVVDLNMGVKIDGKDFVPGEYYFAMRCWSGKNHRSEISNQVNVNVK